MIININGKSYEVNSEADIQALMERFDFQAAFKYLKSNKPSIWNRIFGYLQLLNN